jgi:signal peptidase I
MAPTLSIGQVVTVSLNPNYVPKIGDIVLFHPPAGADPVTPMCDNANQGAGHSQVCRVPTPQESSQLFIKRVVAGPGDTVQMTQGHVIRNGVEEHDSRYTEPCGNDPSCNFLAPVTIPSGDYFVLGDNRGASDDSRFWGPVPGAWMVGKVQQ